MTKRKLGASLAFLLAFAFLLSALNTILQGPPVFGSSGLGVSRMVGAFLPSILALIIGLKLLPPKK